MRPKREYRPYQGKRPMAGWKKWLIALLALVLAGAVAFAALLGVVLAGGHDQLRGDPQVMIVLGCQVREDGPSILLKDRLDKALDYWEDHPEVTVVVSGGQGPNEPVTEARCMADYLIDNGVPEGQILLEDRSRNTVQNLRYSLELLASEGYDTTQDVAVVSNGFHLARVRMLWGRVWGGTYNLSTLAAPSSHAGARMSMYLREPLALVKSFLFDRG